LTSRLFEIAKPHIESSLAKGYEKVEIANLLADFKKYPGAITDYVGAYEEIGQSLFLIETISKNKEISDESLEELFKPGNHNQKILNAYIARRDRIEKEPGNFEKVKKSQVGQDFHNPYNSEGTVKKTNERIALLSKLHKLRQSFDYSHSRDGQINNPIYTDDVLDSFCYYLKAECLSSYYECKLNLEGENYKSKNHIDDLPLSETPSLPSYQKFKELSNELKLKNNMLRREQGLKFLKSF